MKTFISRQHFTGLIPRPSGVHAAARLLGALLLPAALLAVPASAATITDNITVSGTTENRTLDGDTLSGNVLVNNSGIFNLDVQDSTITGNIETASNGLLNLSIFGESLITGNLKADNGGDLNISLNGNSEIRGIIDVDNSGGYLELELNGQSRVSGHISGGSSSLSTITVNDFGTLSGGVESTAGGVVNVTLNDDAYLSGPISSNSSGNLNISANDNARIDGDLLVTGGSSATVTLRGNSAMVGYHDLTDVGGSTLDVDAYDNAQIIGDIETAGGSRGTFDMNGSSSFTGNLLSNGTTYFTLNDSSTLTGSSSITSWGEAHIALNGAGSAWYVTKADITSSAAGATGAQNASIATTLSLASGSWVYLGAQNYSLSSAADRVQLDINSLSGSGNFELRPLISGIGAGASNIGDLIHVTQTAGSHSLWVPSQQLGLGSVAVNGSEVLMLVETQDGGGNFSLYNGQSVDIGHLKYKLVKQGNNWYLVAGEQTGGGGDPDPGNPDPGNPDPGIPGIPNPDPGFGVTPQLSNPAEASASFMSSNYMISFVELQTLVERMGNLRHTRKGDLWLRGYGGRLSSFSFNQLSSYKMNYYGIQGGADFKAAEKDFFLGVMGGYTEAEPDHDYGDSETQSFHAGVYALYGTEQNFYVDAVFKFSHIRDKFEVRDSQDQMVTAEGSSNAYTFSLESGKRFYIADKPEGVYVEPQLQGIFTHQRGLRFDADNGLQTDMDGYNSIIGRGSALLGYNLPGTYAPMDIYLKGGYLREFKGKLDVRYNDNKHDTYRFRGGWWDLDLGITTEINDKHALYLEGGYAWGNRFDQTRINLGYRYAF